MSFEQIPVGRQRLSHKDSGKFCAKGETTIYILYVYIHIYLSIYLSINHIASIYGLWWNSEITPFIFLSGTSQGFINTFSPLFKILEHFFKNFFSFFTFPTITLVFFFFMVGIFTENPIKKGSLACIVSTSTSVCMEMGRGAPSQLKIWNASRICVSSLRRGHANLLCIVPILVYVLPKWALTLIFSGNFGTN